MRSMDERHHINRGQCLFFELQPTKLSLILSIYTMLVTGGSGCFLSHVFLTHLFLSFPVYNLEDAAFPLSLYLADTGPSIS